MTDDKENVFSQGARLSRQVKVGYWHMLLKNSATVVFRVISTQEVMSR
jgi:hypothetical protein